MSSSFAKEFSDLFDAILLDYKNQFEDAASTKGSLVWIKSACLASALWGIYKYQDYIAAQIFPDTADTSNLEHHASVHNITRKTDEIDANLLERLLAHIQDPPAGGKASDYETWALTFDNVDAAYCIPNGQGVGTVDVVIVADANLTGSEVPSSHSCAGTCTSVSSFKLIDSAAAFTTSGTLVRIGDVVTHMQTAETATVTAIDDSHTLTLDTDIFASVGDGYSIASLCRQVKSYIDNERPVTVSAIRVLPPTVVMQDVAMTVTGNNLDKAVIATNVETYLNGLKPGTALYITQLTAIAIAAGAVNAVITTPSADVSITNYQMIRAGTVTVS